MSSEQCASKEQSNRAVSKFKTTIERTIQFGRTEAGPRLKRGRTTVHRSESQKASMMTTPTDRPTGESNAIANGAANGAYNSIYQRWYRRYTGPPRHLPPVCQNPLHPRPACVYIGSWLFKYTCWPASSVHRAWVRALPIPGAGRDHGATCAHCFTPRTKNGSMMRVCGLR